MKTGCITPMESLDIDVEVISAEYPQGCFIAKVNSESFNEDMFDFFHPNTNKDGWTQVLVGESMEGSYVSDGEVVFIDPQGGTHWTGDTSVLQAQDVNIIYSEDASSEKISM